MYKSAFLYPKQVNFRQLKKIYFHNIIEIYKFIRLTLQDYFKA
jgi:hypothetical protein